MVKELLSTRKQDHINFANQAQSSFDIPNSIWDYEPLLGVHPKVSDREPFEFLGKTMMSPLWISSMTGGTQRAQKINERLARVAGEFGLGMGLGSMRALFENSKTFEDFNLRRFLGNDVPFYGNLGIAQIQEYLENKKLAEVKDVISELSLDGMIIHVNPLQEWLQEEGDKITRPPIEIIKEFLSETKIPLIIKEVGQGMGPRSLKALMKLPLMGIEFGAYGGTNFSKLEILRNSSVYEGYEEFSKLGHTAEEMVCFINKILEKEDCRVQNFIISGGIKNFFQGCELRTLCKAKSVYAQGKPFLENAVKGYDELQEFVTSQVLGIQMMENFLKFKELKN